MTIPYSLQKFLIGLFALAVVFLMVGIALPSLDQSIPASAWAILIFVVLSTLLVHVAFIFGSRQSGQTSIGLLMGTIVGHMLINILFILPLLYFNQEAVVELTLVFFVTLIVFMIYEITMITLFINSKTSE